MSNIKFLKLLRNSFWICIILVSCKEKKQQEQGGKKEEKPPIVDVIVAKTQSTSKVIEANGSIVANEYVELHPEVSGRIVYLNIPEGASITQGTVLARINDAELQAQLRKTGVQLEMAQKTEQRLAKLLEIKGINQADYDVSLNQVNTLKADLEYTKTLIEKTVLKAPFSGVIGLRQISLGAYITPASILATMQQVSTLKVDFTLPEEYANNFRKGSVVEVEVDVNTHKRCKAVVIAKEPQINLTTRNQKTRAILQGCNVNPGTFVKVYINTGNDKNSILVPTNSIIPDDIGKKIVVVRNGLAHYTTIETGERTTENVEVTRGISQGDTIVVSGVLFTKPEKPVTIRKVL